MNGIRYFRKKNHLTQSDLAEMLGVMQTSVSQWEGGRNYPDIKMAKRLATMFDATLDQILGMEDMSEKPLVDAMMSGAIVAEKLADIDETELLLLEQKGRLLKLMDQLTPLARQRVIDRAELYYEVESMSKIQSATEEE